MSGNVLHVGATVNCPHQGSASALPAQSRVLVDGRPVAGLADFWTVTGCAFTVGNKPQPCVSVTWLAPAARVQVNGSPALLQSSAGLCQSAERIPQGPPNVVMVQQRVVAR